MQVKRTTRRYTFAIPHGSTKRMVRTYLQAVDGTQYPHDQEIEVPDFRAVDVDYVYGHGTGKVAEDFTEEKVLPLQPPGARAVACRDLVELLEVPDPPQPKK